MSAPRVALFTDLLDWHAAALLEAFDAAGARATAVRLADCGFDTEAPGGLLLPGDWGAGGLPDAAYVRSLDGGSFEAVTKRLSVLHALDALGVPVWNTARAIERCVDKAATCFLLGRAGVPTPPCWTVEGRAAAAAVLAHAGGEVVVKPLFGAQGRGLLRVRRAEELPDEAAVDGVYHLQRFVEVEGSFHDHRILVCDGAPFAAMTRRGRDWITNVQRGGTPEPFAPDATLAALAVRAAAAVGAAVAGVDIIRGRDGTPYVLEVNSMPGWRGLQTVTRTPVASHLAAALLRACR